MSRNTPPTGKQMEALYSTPLMPGWDATLISSNYIILSSHDYSMDAWVCRGRVMACWYSYTTPEEWAMLQRVCQRVWHRGIDPALRVR